jgi:hypothetical protein
LREVAFDIVARVDGSYYPVEVIAPIIPYPGRRPGRRERVRLLDVRGVLSDFGR